MVPVGTRPAPRARRPFPGRRASSSETKGTGGMGRRKADGKEGGRQRRPGVHQGRVGLAGGRRREWERGLVRLTRVRNPQKTTRLGPSARPRLRTSPVVHRGARRLRRDQAGLRRDGVRTHPEGVHEPCEALPVGLCAPAVRVQGRVSDPAPEVAPKGGDCPGARRRWARTTPATRSLDVWSRGAARAAAVCWGCPDATPIFVN
jgi:hypothetical protein